MNEKNVTSLAWSKTLKELGVEQRSEFYWVEFEHNSMYPDQGVESRTHLFSSDEVNKRNGASRSFRENMERGKGVDAIYSAFLTDELAGMLPFSFYKNNARYFFNIKRYPAGWCCFYEATAHSYIGTLETKRTVPNALAAMVEYCKQNKII